MNLFVLAAAALYLFAAGQYFWQGKPLNGALFVTFCVSNVVIFLIGEK